MHFRREEREYSVTLGGVNMDISAKLPPHSGEGEDGLLYERLYLYEDLWFIIEGLYRRFALERTHDTWMATLNALREWVAGGPSDAVPAPDIASPVASAAVVEEGEADDTEESTDVEEAAEDDGEASAEDVADDGSADDAEALAAVPVDESPALTT